MSHRIRCYTLFDITQTGVSNRSKPQGSDVAAWIHKRNTQCNFDTVLQVISLRSQPEVINTPHTVDFTFDELAKFGLSYQEDKETYQCWRFDFEVYHTSVFEDGTNDLGALYRDCESVPMIICEGQYKNTPAFLNITTELKNIHFEVI